MGCFSSVVNHTYGLGIMFEFHPSQAGLALYLDPKLHVAEGLAFELMCPAAIWVYGFNSNSVPPHVGLVLGLDLKLHAAGGTKFKVICPSAIWGMAKSQVPGTVFSY